MKHRASSLSSAYVLLRSDNEPKLANDNSVFTTPFVASQHIYAELHFDGEASRSCLDQ